MFCVKMEAILPNNVALITTIVVTAFIIQHLEILKQLVIISILM